MKISVVTISYNQAPFLHDCIDSVLKQDHDDVEYVVVDPGSTDGSREIIASYGDRITTVFEADAGPADGLNKGFARATGDVFGFLNSDDMLLPGALARVSRAFASMPGVDVITGCGFYVDALGRRQRRIIPSKMTPWLCAHGAVTVFQQGTFFRRAAFESAGGFNPSNRIAWDGELFLDMALSGAHFARIGDDLALFRMHGDSITGSGGHTQANEAYRTFRDHLLFKVTGRPRSRADWAWDRVARVAKYAADPVYVAYRTGAACQWARRKRMERRVPTAAR